jgi:hypothetical protein
MSEIDKTLEQRGNRYGDFTDHADICQHLKYIMHTTENWERLSADKKEALDMIQHKIARILNGDANYKDHWHDIQGYAKLAEERCVISEEEID